MMKNVLYLCLNNKFRYVGFVFPDELEEKFYSPGFFIIESKEKLSNQVKKFHDEYLFLAIEEGSVVSNTLKLKENNMFVVSTEKYGEFVFEAICAPPTINRYVGNRSNFEEIGYNNFYILKCVDLEKLEYVCKKNDFYFIGSTE